jgi:hypothetical protein
MHRLQKRIHNAAGLLTDTRYFDKEVSFLTPPQKATHAGNQKLPAVPCKKVHFAKTYRHLTRV